MTSAQRRRISASAREVLTPHAKAGRFVMIELRPRREDDAVVGPPEPQAVVDVVEVDREAFVEAAHLVEDRAAASSGTPR